MAPQSPDWSVGASQVINEPPSLYLSVTLDALWNETRLSGRFEEIPRFSFAVFCAKKRKMCWEMSGKGKLDFYIG